MDRAIFDYIKSHWDCISYAHDVLGLPVYKDGDRCKSFRPDAENPTSLQVFHDYYFDWGDGTNGDVITLCANAKYNGDIGKALKELAGDFFITSDKNYSQYSSELNEKIDRWHSGLRDVDVQYLHSRKITDETISRLKLGYDAYSNRLVIPYWKNGHVVYYASRDRSGQVAASKYKKAFIDDLNEHVPWGLHSLSKNFLPELPNAKTTSDHRQLFRHDYLCLLEGAFDAMSFEQEGFHVLSPIGGHFNKYQESIFFAAAKNFPCVFILFDSDGPGVKFQQKAARICFEKQIPFCCGHLPPNIKDVSDYYCAGGNLADLIANAEPGLVALAKTFTNKDLFSKFLRSAARFVPFADLVDLCLHMTQFNKEWLKALLQECRAYPKENLIVDDIKKNYTIKYLVDSAFFEYQHGAWVKQPNEFIQQHVKKSLGLFASNGRINSITNHLKIELASIEEFNKMNVFNFLNGILDLDSCTLKQHDPAFMSSVQAHYSFDENATAPRWNNFLHEVMANNTAKINLLQEAAGYILFSDCSLEKCFMLIGDGANGKSVFINTLINVFGPDNCSNVTISDLASPFEPIRLRYSIANFSTEMKSDIKGALEKFKLAISGETLTAAHKGQDSISFKSRAKWIFSANNFISANDISYGFLRRPSFIKFTETFTGQNADKTLPAKLQQEIPGIFNWCLEGYQRLRKNMQFTKTLEESELEQDFMQEVSPIAAYYSEILSNFRNIELPVKEIYSSVNSGFKPYTDWCKESGFQPMSRIKFTRTLRQIATQKRKDIFMKRSTSGNVFHFGDGENF